MNNFDIMNEIGKVTDLNSISDFIIMGGVIGVIGYIGFSIMTGSVPGIIGLIAPAAAGAILGAMLYIFAIGTS